MSGFVGIAVFLLLQSFLVEGSHYSVKVQTGRSLGASTDADVYIKIYGVGGVKKTSGRELSSGRDDFETGRLDKFNVYDGVDVGMIEYIEIYRTGQSFFGDWQLNWIRITHNGKDYLFRYNNNWVPKKKWIRINGKCKPPGYRLGHGDQCISQGQSGPYYSVKVQTGSSLMASTDADVFIKIYGVGGVKKTSRRELASSGNDFEQGQLDKFSVFDDVDVGMIEYIEIYRTEGWPFGSWQLSWIRITHNGKDYLFPYNNNWVDDRKWIRINGKCKPPGYRLGPGDKCVR